MLKLSDLLGQTNNEGILISGPDDIGKIDIYPACIPLFPDHNERKGI